MQDFRNLKVWEKGHVLTLAVYKASVEVKRMLAALIQTVKGDN